MPDVRYWIARSVAEKAFEMRTPLVTEESVHAAADALVAAGKEVTCIAVRKQLGGGSLRDISPHVKSWRLKRVPQIDPVSDSDEPSGDLAKCVRDLVGKVQVVATSRAAHEVHLVRQQLDARNLVVSTQLDAALREIHDLLEEVDQQAESSAALQARLDQERQRAQELSRELVDERTQQAVALAAAKEAQARISDLKDAQTGLLRELAVERDATERLRQREGELENELKEVRAGSAWKEVEAARLLGQAEATNQQLAEQVERLGNQLLAARQELYNSHLALVEMTEEAAKALGEAKASAQHWEDLQVALERRQPGTAKAKAGVTDINAKVTP